MTSDKQLEQFLAVTAAEVGWDDFQEYLDLRAKGLRRQGLDMLRSFLAEASARDLEFRKALVCWVSIRLEGAQLRKFKLDPQFVRIDLIDPTVREWLAQEPKSTLAWYLLGSHVLLGGHQQDLEALRQSVSLDPSFQRPRRDFISRVVGHAFMSQHELPDFGYNGEAEVDASNLEEALEMLAGVSRPLWRETIEAELHELLDIARAWQRFEQSGQRSFSHWCAANNGPASMYVTS